ncbi:MAG: hypothetical protein KDB88_01255 [Flavobacteriales bacterium]|nr:hypothetical protein [Flavobacteriales bacterium]
MDRTSFLSLAGFFTVLLIPAVGWAQVPVNDSCAFATPLTVNATADCPFQGVAGDNSQATFWGIEPICDGGSSLGYADVWYSFNSGNATEVDIELLIGTIADWGVEVLDSCDGNSVVCFTWPLLSSTAQVVPNTSYLLRVFTNLDFDDPGTFNICVSSMAPPPDCEGANVKTSDQQTLLFVCSDGIPDPITMANTSPSLPPSEYGYVITDTMGIIEFADISGVFDADTLRVDEHWVHGFSYIGNISGNVPGNRLNDIETDGSCIDFSDNYVQLFVELCTSVPLVTAEGWSVYGLGSDRLLVEHPSVSAGFSLEIVDLMGRTCHQKGYRSSGDRTLIELPIGMAAGMHVVRVLHAGVPVAVIRVLL